MNKEKLKSIAFNTFMAIFCITIGILDFKALILFMCFLGIIRICEILEKIEKVFDEGVVINIRNNIYLPKHKEGENKL